MFSHNQFFLLFKEKQFTDVSEKIGQKNRGTAEVLTPLLLRCAENPMNCPCILRPYLFLSLRLPSLKLEIPVERCHTNPLIALQSQILRIRAFLPELQNKFTKNLPILSKIMGLHHRKHGKISPNKFLILTYPFHFIR